jgi:hypothetical protein
VTIVPLTLRWPLIRSSVVLMFAARPVAVRVRVAGAAMLMTVSVAAGPVPVLAHGGRIRRLAVVGQRVTPSGSPASMNYSHFAYNPRAHETLCRHSRL